ncbi:MAG: pitrilysin family protein [Kofleriaceae bacterium]
MYALLPMVFLAAGSRSTEPPKIQTHTCPNGLTVLVVENHAVPLITVEITAKNGSMTEAPEYNGLSHLYEHMFFKANAVLTSQEAYMKRATELGMSWNGTTNTERVNYFFTTTTDHLKDSMVFLRDAVVSPAFDAKELERERVVVTGEIDRNEASPYYHLFHAISQRVWWKYPSRKDPLGRRATVLGATVAQMRTIQHRYYVPNNSALVVTGDVHADEIFAQADALYAGWKRAEDPFKKLPLVKHPPIKRTEVAFVEQPVQVVTGTFEWHGPSTVGAHVADTYAADALGTALAEPSSRFQKALVDSGDCVSAGLSWYTQMNTGPISISFNATPAKVDACITAILGELAKLSTAYVTEPELARAAHTLEVDQVREREKASELAHTLTFWWTSAGLPYYLGYVDHLYKVTVADTTRFVTTWLTGKPYVLGVMVSPEMKRAGLDQAHFEKLIGIGGKAAK